MDFNNLCEYLADGSTVTAADVSAVMKQIEMRLPLVLGFNSKVVCSPEGLTFRPKVSGSITQSQLKAKLMAKLEADPTLDIDVNRELLASDLAISDLTASIAIELPSKWIDRFKSKAEFKRVKKATATTDDSDSSTSEDDTNTTNNVPSGNEGTPQGSGTNTNTDPGTVNPTPSTGGDDNGGYGGNGGGGSTDSGDEES